MKKKSIHVLVSQGFYQRHSPLRAALREFGVVFEFAKGYMPEVEKMAQPDLVLLNGEASAASIKTYNAPVAVWLEEADSVVCARMLNAGAEDCLREGMEPVEIAARFQVVLRHSQMYKSSGRVKAGNLEIDLGTQQVWKEGCLVPLSPTETRLLMLLAEYPGETLSSTNIILRVWGIAYVDETRYLRLYIRYLRQKLEDDPAKPKLLVNAWGRGYRLVVLEAVTTS